MNQIPIVVYTASYCPYCTRAKALLTAQGLSYHEIDVTHDEKGRAELVEKAEGRRTVPQIFIYGKPIGGCDDLFEKVRTGELDKLLKQGEA